MMTSTVRIPWSREYDTIYKWNEVCARAIEMFGLPGDRFTTSANVNYMDFTFNSNKDALMFAIEHNGRIVPEDELTVELISSFMQ
jgi:hypothetical protein